MDSFSVSVSHIKSSVCSRPLSSSVIRANMVWIVDAQMVQDTDRFTMDLTGGLERVLHGKVKPSIYRARAKQGRRLISHGSDHPMFNTTLVHAHIDTSAAERRSNPARKKHGAPALQSPHARTATVNPGMLF